jgi:hypothetical protein
MQADDRRGFAFIEVTKNGLNDIDAKLFPSVGFRDNGMSERARDEAPVSIVFGNLKYDFAHGFTVAEDEVIGKKVYQKRTPTALPLYSGKLIC